MGALPPSGRESFESLISKRAAVRAYFENSIPWEKSDIPTNPDNPATRHLTPRRQLIHLIGNTRIRALGIETGTIDTWNYSKTNRGGFWKLASLGKEELIEQLDEATSRLYSTYSKPEDQGKEIVLPYGNRGNVLGLIAGGAEHEAGHMMSLLTYAAHFGYPEPPEAAKIYGKWH